MVAIGFALLGVGLVVVVMLALADPVLLSRINGEPAEGGSGRFIDVDKAGDADVVRLAPRPGGGDRRAPKAA
ncbi:hypothetical protein [Nonomuraea sp. SYSU D8015]|uniref:hypothetical protein n=1 Tax=Nonomuraea sp. SYSU D8015 TaxID=2593644 RepID=UPI001660716F|nr:hypothetical protein [Nonomuraea sp. SYSU D8015]